jgi:hypothetical protein
MEIRTPVLTLKGLRPGPLDDGGLQLTNTGDSSPRCETEHLEAAPFQAGGLYHPLADWSSNRLSFQV